MMRHPTFFAFLARICFTRRSFTHRCLVCGAVQVIMTLYSASHLQHLFQVQPSTLSQNNARLCLHTPTGSPPRGMWDSVCDEFSIRSQRPRARVPASHAEPQPFEVNGWDRLDWSCRGWLLMWCYYDMWLAIMLLNNGHWLVFLFVHPSMSSAHLEHRSYRRRPGLETNKDHFN